VKKSPLIFILPALLLACSPQASEPEEPPSKIVELVEKAGLGPVKKADSERLNRFLNANTSLTVQVWDLCAPLLKTKIGTPWDTTSEGRVCRSAQWASKPRPPLPKGEVFKGGSL
jgi:hypothetical protein